MNTSLWNQISSSLEQEILPLNYSLFLSGVGVSGDADELVLICSNEFVLEQVRTHYEERIRELARQFSGKELAVRVTCEVTTPVPAVRVLPAQAAVEPAPSAAGVLLPPEVVEGPENLFAWQALRQAIAFPGRYNPLFVHGKTGVGKSLYLATLAAAYEKRGKKVMLLRGFEFMNQYTMAVQNRAYDGFYQHFRGLDLLCIDDVQYLGGKDRTQETFQNIFEVLYDSGSQIALSADREPAAIPGLMEALVSRLSWGLIVELAPPSELTRRRLIERWSRQAQPLPAPVVERLVAHPFASVRAFEGVLTRLWAQMEIFGRPVGLREAQEELERTGDETAPLGLSEIERLVCDHFQLSSQELTGKGRALRVARPRQLAMYLAKKHGSSSYPVIGEYFGMKSHSTVISACRRIEKLRRSDRQLSLDLEEIEKNLK